MRRSTRIRLRQVASWASTRCSTVRCSVAAIGCECRCDCCAWPTASNSGRRASTRTSRRSSTCRTPLPQGSRRPCRCAGSQPGSTRGAPYTQDPEAYALYASGRFAWTRQTEPSLLQAIVFFEQAIARDPNYALAYAGLADSYAMLGVFGMRAPHDVFPKARGAVEKALSIDPDLAAAHAALGHIKMIYEHDWDGAARSMQRALQLDPSLASDVSPARPAVRDAGRLRSRVWQRWNGRNSSSRSGSRQGPPPAISSTTRDATTNRSGSSSRFSRSTTVLTMRAPF